MDNIHKEPSELFFDQLSVFRSIEVLAKTRKIHRVIIVGIFICNMDLRDGI